MSASHQPLRSFFSVNAIVKVHLAAGVNAMLSLHVIFSLGIRASVRVRGRNSVSIIFSDRAGQKHQRQRQKCSRWCQRQCQGQRNFWSAAVTASASASTLASAFRPYWFQVDVSLYGEALSIHRELRLLDPPFCERLRKEVSSGQGAVVRLRRITRT